MEASQTLVIVLPLPTYHTMPAIVSGSVFSIRITLFLVEYQTLLITYLLHISNMLSTVSISRLVILLLIVNTCVSEQCPPKVCGNVRYTFETEAPSCKCELKAALTPKSGSKTLTETLTCILDTGKHDIPKSSRCRTECCKKWSRLNT